jgi:uncharacterized protein YecT (DUF1311 family)
MFRLSTAILILFLAISCTVSAAEAGTACNPEGNQAEMNACAVQEFQQADRELNDVYKQAMSTLSRSRQYDLRRQQRAWLKSRDPQCRKKADEEGAGGSIWPLLYEGCRAEATRRRVDELRQMLKK